MNNQYKYTRNEIHFILQHLNESKVKDLLSLGRNELRDNFILKCVDVARAFAFLSYNEQNVLRHLFFYKDSPGVTSWKLRIDKEKVFYVKRIGLNAIAKKLNGPN